MEMNHDPEWLKKKADAEDGCNVSVGGLVTNLEGGMTTEIARKLIADALPGLDVDTFNRVIGPLTDLVLRVAGTPGMADLYREIFEWSECQFGEGRGPGPALAHLRAEAAELQASPQDLMEYADVLMLTFDACAKAGYSFRDLNEALAKKLAINKSRKWGKPNAEGFTEHVR